MEDLLQLVDQALARRSEEFCPDTLKAEADLKQYLAPENATILYWEARYKGLKDFQAACASYIGAHVKEVAKAAPTDPLGPVLVQAAARSCLSLTDISSIRDALEALSQRLPSELTTGYGSSYIPTYQGIIANILQTIKN